MPTVLVSTAHECPWHRHFPDGKPVWGEWRFIFNDHEQIYDYLVVVDDAHTSFVPSNPQEQSAHIASEPYTWLRYRKEFTDQFGLCITHDTERDHPAIYPQQPGLIWHIGWQTADGSIEDAMSFREIERLFDEERGKTVAVVSSNKTATKEHRQRLQFALALKDALGDKIDLFGRGIRDMDDKLQALRGYRFAVVLENAKLPHYFTEKLTDAYLCGTYPLYHGCTNIDEYFPKDSLLPIDITNLDASVAAIEEAIKEDLDKVNRDALQKARDLSLTTHNFPAMVSRVLQMHVDGQLEMTAPPRRLGGKIIPFRSREFRKRFGKEGGVKARLLKAMRR